MAMTPEEHERLIKKTQATKQAIEEIKKQAAQRKLDARRKIEDIKIADKKIAIVRAASGNNGIAKLNEERSKQQVLRRGEILEIAEYANVHYSLVSKIIKAWEGR